MPQEINNSSQTAEATGEKTITGETETLKEEYTTTDSDKKCNISRKWRKRNNRRSNNIKNRRRQHKHRKLRILWNKLRNTSHPKLNSNNKKNATIETNAKRK